MRHNRTRVVSIGGGSLLSIFCHVSPPQSLKCEGRLFHNFLESEVFEASSIEIVSFILGSESDGEDDEEDEEDEEEEEDAEEPVAKQKAAPAKQVVGILFLHVLSQKRLHTIWGPFVKSCGKVLECIFHFLRKMSHRSLIASPQSG